MKICVSTNKGGLEENVNPHFGRAPTFTFVSIDKGEIKDVEVVANPFAAAAGGAGVQSAQLAAEKGVGAVISGSFGPHAHTAFQAAKIEVVAVQNMTVKDAALGYAKGEIKPISQQTIQGMPGGMMHHGAGERHGHGRGCV